MDAQEQIYGAFLLNELLPDSIVKEFIDCMPDYYIPPEKPDGLTGISLHSSTLA